MANKTTFQNYFRSHPEAAENILNIVYPGVEIIKYSPKYQPFLAFPYTWVCIEAKDISLCIDNAHHNKYVSYFNKGTDKLTFSFNIWKNNNDKTKTPITHETKIAVVKYITEELGLNLITADEFVVNKLQFFTPEDLKNMLNV